MATDSIYPYYLRTATTSDGHHTLEAARAALKQFIAGERGQGYQVVSQLNCRWISHRSTESVEIWIEEQATGHAVLLNAPVTRTSKVTVYAFTVYDIDSDNQDPRPVKALRETIGRIRGEAIEASAEEVDESLLDGQGYYRSQQGN